VICATQGKEVEDSSEVKRDAPLLIAGTSAVWVRGASLLVQRFELQSPISLLSLNESRLVERFPEITIFAGQWDGEVPSW